MQSPLVKKKSPTSAWRPSTYSIRKALRPPRKAYSWPAVAVAAALAGARFQQNPKPQALRRMFDDFYNCIGEINDHIELQLNDRG